MCVLISNCMCSALLYSAFGVIIEKARGAEDDLNTIAAGTLTGVLYKSPGRSYVYYIVLSLRSKENAFCQQTEGEDTAMLCTNFSVED